MNLAAHSLNLINFLMIRAGARARTRVVVVPIGNHRVDKLRRAPNQ